METVRCFREDQDTRELKKKKQYPEILLRSFSSEAQSASESARVGGRLGVFKGGCVEGDGNWRQR